MVIVGKFKNPFRPGAGHQPPYLAGRKNEIDRFESLLSQEPVLENLVLTGLRGVGKTVLLETFKPVAISRGWLWAGSDLSESSSITEANMATRIITDLSVVITAVTSPGGNSGEQDSERLVLDYTELMSVYQQTPGLVADKLKAVLELTWSQLRSLDKRGVVFAYDEAQNLSDHAAKDEFPLSLLLEVFQSIQRKGLPFLLVLTGLPTLAPKLVEARTYAERMFRIMTLGPLSQEETREAVEKGIEDGQCPLHLSPESIETIWQITKGYPYFVQYVCREAFDVWVQNAVRGQDLEGVRAEAILRKLDADFFAGRWLRITDRQRELLIVIASLDDNDGEFTVQQLVDRSKVIVSHRPFSNSHANQMLSALGESGLIYKNRHGKYSFAVPLMDRFIRRQTHLPLPLLP